MKTERTLQIEQMLNTYYPETLAGCKLNNFRGRAIGFEVPVTCGTISDGLIDCVRIDEILVNGRHTLVCSPGNHKEWYKKNNPNVLEYIGNTETKEIGCVRGFKTIDELPQYCDELKCGGCSYTNNYDNDILTTAFEVKVTKEDFHSKHGHNFVCNANYYVMPKELYQQVKEEIPEDIGVIVHEVSEKTNRLRRVKECKLRHLLDGQQKWLILSVLKKQPGTYFNPPRNEYGEEYDLWR